MKENAVLDTKRKLTKCSSYGDCHFDEMSHLNGILIEHNAELIDKIHTCAHDIREPIRCLDGVMQLYNIELETYQNEISEEYIQIIFGSINRIKELVSEYLEIKSTDNTKRNWDVIDSLRIISSAKEYLYVQIKSTNTIINVIPPLLPIFGNLVQIKQVFSNLIDNAIKYRSVEPPLITISSVNKNGFVYFSVEDNGIGIPG